MKLIAGLGNPGKEYENTRHNVGFLVADVLAKTSQIDISQTRFKALIGKGEIDGQAVVISKPQTYMNRSGESVLPLLSFFRLNPSDCIVICDDLDLPAGKIRVRAGGGHGGHNGLRSIIEQTGSKEFIRVRIGIGRPADKSQVSSHVLSHFSKEEKPLISDAVERASRAVVTIITGGIDECMNRFN